MRFGGQKWKKSKIKIWNLEGNEKFLLWKCAYFSRNMKGKVIYKPFFIFFVYPLRGPSPVGKLTLKNLKTHFSFYLYIYTPKLGVAIILKGFFVFMTHPNVDASQWKEETDRSLHDRPVSILWSPKPQPLYRKTQAVKLRGRI